MAPAGLSINADDALRRLRNFQRSLFLLVRDRRSPEAAAVERTAQADTIYALDAAVEPMVEEFFREWGREVPLVLIAEGMLDENGRENARVFPEATPAQEAKLRVIIDPIDGTRLLMHDKRSAWSLAGVAPNRGQATRLSDFEVAVMTELPTRKAGFADVFWAIRGQGAHGERIDLRDGSLAPLAFGPSPAQSIDHGFASVTSFFPGTKVLAAELMEFLADHLVGPADVHRATVFDDQYISTAGQWHELMVGHDRFSADLRPAFHAVQGQEQGLSCHPYDCAALLIAQEAGVIITDEQGRPLDAPLDTTTGVNWLGYANESLRREIQPLVQRFLRERRV